MVAKTVIPVLQKQFPHSTFVISVSTLSGLSLAKSALSHVPIVAAPFDLRFSVKRFVSQVQPRVLILIETELWPNLVHTCFKKSVPVIIINGRLSPRKFPKYKKYRWIMPPVFPFITHAFVQEEIYRDRFVSLGLDPSKISITGNIKIDGVDTVCDEIRKEHLRKKTGFGNDKTVLIFGSTRPGDELLASHCWNVLKNNYPNLRLVIAPRHLDRINEIISYFQPQDVLLWSTCQELGNPSNSEILIVDTLGELRFFYAIATLAVIGGSFYAGVEGHNPLESAALGIPTVFGPYMGNFPDAAELLIHSGGAIQVRSPEELLPLLQRLLDDVDLRTNVSNAGREAILKNQGAATRTIAHLAQVLQRQFP